MTETRSQQEPSMEEILASIRRIISEDGQEPQAKGEQEVERDKAAEQPEPAPARPEGKIGEAPAQAAPSEGGDVLVLTEMVAEDGSVVSLAARSAADADLTAVSEATGLPEPPGEPEEKKAVEQDSPAGKDENDAGAGRWPDRTLPIDGRPEDAEGFQPQAATAPATSADQQMEKEAVSNEVRKKLDLVSQEAETTSTAALSELARAVAREKDLPTGGGRMVEDLVREALQPMLREWLDANLPALVERLVRGEIQRMVRRAEDNA